MTFDVFLQPASSFGRPWSREELQEEGPEEGQEGHGCVTGRNEETGGPAGCYLQREGRCYGNGVSGCPSRAREVKYILYFAGILYAPLEVNYSEAGSKWQRDNQLAYYSFDFASQL